MYEVNRSVIIVKPRQPFVDWLLGLPFEIDTDEVNLVNLRRDSNALLVPAIEDYDDLRAVLKQRWPDIFEAELADWCADDTLWPEKRTQNLFSQWFEIELSSVLTDLCDEPLEREAYDDIELPDAE